LKRQALELRYARGMAAPRLALAAFVLSTLLLCGCDLGEQLSLVEPDGSRVLCPNGQRTSFDYLYPVVNADTGKTYYEEKGRMRVDPRGGGLQTEPDAVGVGLLRGSLADRRVPWVKLTVYCGDSKTPFIETPKIAFKDLRVGTGKYSYEYVVAPR
jgi:hypothetical protein